MQDQRLMIKPTVPASSMIPSDSLSAIDRHARLSTNRQGGNIIAEWRVWRAEWSDFGRESCKKKLFERKIKGDRDIWMLQRIKIKNTIRQFFSVFSGSLSSAATLSDQSIIVGCINKLQEIAVLVSLFDLTITFSLFPFLWFHSKLGNFLGRFRLDLCTSLRLL